MENGQGPHDGQGRRRGTLRLATGILGAAALLGALACFYVGWHESRVIAALRDHGVTVPGQWVRGHVSVSRNGRNRGGTYRAMRFDRYRYQVAGRGYEIEDTGTAMPPQRARRSFDVHTGPRAGMPRVAPIVYLPEQPSVARLRAQLVSGGRALAIIGACLAIVGLLLIAGGWWLSRATNFSAQAVAPSRRRD